MAPGDASAQRTAFADEVRLADECIELARAHPGGQRLPLGRGLEERLGTGADGAPGCWHGAGDGSAAVAGQAKRNPVAVAMAQSAMSSMMRPPPMIVTRRRSRAT